MYTLPDNADVMGPLARDIAFAMEAATGQRYRNGSWSITLDYIGGGATIDYLQAQRGIPSLTLELRPGDGQSGGFAPSTSHIQPSIAENIPGAFHFLQWARDQALDATSPTLRNVRVIRVSDREATLGWETDDVCHRAAQWLSLIHI